MPGDHPLIRAAEESQLVLLGWFRGVRTVLLDLGPISTQDTEPELLPGARFEELRPLANTLPAEEGGLLAYARAMAVWRARHRYCGVCASSARARARGPRHALPEVRPPVLPAHRSRDHRARGGWRPLPAGAPGAAGRRAAIPRSPGFVEPGESLEDAVAREVLEETAVRVRTVNYHSSQPWPFPSSLMVGFHATADSSQPVQVTTRARARPLVHAGRADAGAAAAAALAIHLLSADHHLAAASRPWRRTLKAANRCACWFSRGMRIRVIGWYSRRIATSITSAPRSRSPSGLPRTTSSPGRDQSAGGTWLGLDRARRFGVVTNFRELQRPRRSAPSRGRLIPDYLARAANRRRAISPASKPMRRAIRASTCVVGDADQLWYASNRMDRFAQALPAGVHGLSERVPGLALAQTPARAPEPSRPGSRMRPRHPPPADGDIVERLFAMLADRTPGARRLPRHRPSRGLGTHTVVTFRHTPDLWNTVLDRSC